jgi:hypothetical protein
MRGSNYVLRGEAAQLLAAEGAPAVNPEPHPSQNEAALAELDAWLKQRLADLEAAKSQRP